MMRRIFFIVLLVLLAGSIAWGIWHFFFRESDEMIIRRNFSELNSNIGQSAFSHDTIFNQLETAKKISRRFTEIATFDLPGLHTARMSRENIVSNVMMLRKHISSLSLHIDDMSLEFDQKHTKCTVLFSLMVVGKSNSGRMVRESYDLDSSLIRKDGDWLIEKVRFQNILKR